MNRISTIKTKIRPVKKLFLIEQDDIKQLGEIIHDISMEISGISNLILTNDEGLFAENTIQFVDRHDPDVVINYTSLSDDDVTRCYRIPSFSGELRDSALKRLSIPFGFVDNVPYPLKLKGCEEIEAFYSCFRTSIDISDPLSLMSLLHFGIADEDYEDKFEHTAYEGMQIAQVKTIDQLTSSEDLSKRNLLYTLLDLVGIGEGTSVWHLRRNPGDLFKDKPTVVIGSKQNLRSMVYFWNMRATYPYNHTIWFPAELLDENEAFLKGFSHCCAFAQNEKIQRLIEDLGLNEIDCSRYYFETYVNEWDTYEHFQNVSIINEKVRVYHPFDKLFSKEGFNMNLVLQVSGLEELHVPKSLMLGRLFVTLPDSDLFGYYFARTHKRSLSLFVDHLEPYRQTPIVEELRLPNTENILQTIFNEHQLELKETPTTGMAQEVIEVIGGYDGLDLIADPTMFRLLVKLTPPRTEKIRSLLLEFVGETEAEKLQNVIESNLTPFATINSDVIVSIDDMSSMLPIRREERGTIYPLIQELHDRRILLRGKYFLCPYCRSKLWYPFEDISEENKCHGCNRLIPIPVFSGEKVLGDYFRLNELVSMAVDQGLLPLALAVRFLYRQSFYVKRFMYNCDVCPSGSTDRLAEIDLVFTIGDKLGLSEVKADRGFSHHQTDRLLEIAGQVNADVLLFSTLKDKDSDEVKDLAEYLRAKSLRMPAFIVTGEVLFSKEVVSMASFFRVSRATGEFPQGPIVI